VRLSIKKERYRTVELIGIKVSAGVCMTSLDLISQVKKRIVNLTDTNLAIADVTLTNCDREPIHIPSIIQSHGVLLTFDEISLVILQISQNSEAFLGKKPETGQCEVLCREKRTFLRLDGCKAP
jgi:PAS fold